MLDISWTEFLLIAVVALIFIGPKELPSVLRTMGQWTRRVRSMASDFQSQFQEAMREAEMADLKKHVDDIAHDIKSYDPLKDVRADIEAIGKNLDESVKGPDKAADQSAAAGAPDTPGNTAPAPSAEAFPIPQAAAELRDKGVAGAGVGPVAPDAAAESASSIGSGRAQ